MRRRSDVSSSLSEPTSPITSSGLSMRHLRQLLSTLSLKTDLRLFSSFLSSSL